MKKALLFSLLINCCFLNIAKAIQPNCPSVDSIISSDFNEVIEESGQLGVRTHSFYNTDTEWYFVMAVNAKSKDEVIKKAKLMLKSLKFVYGPVSDGKDGWWCQYKTNFHGIPAPITKTSKY